MPQFRIRFLWNASWGIPFRRKGAGVRKRRQRIGCRAYCRRASQEVQNGFHVEDIIVEGYASPEGTPEENERLAIGRAKAAAELVQEELHTHLDPSHIKLHSNGGDWNGLIEAILGSDIADKEAIAKEIEESSNREETLRKLMAKYSEIEPLLPQLRRANVTITTIKD